jgi:hypothetical protein
MLRRLMPWIRARENQCILLVLDLCTLLKSQTTLRPYARRGTPTHYLSASLPT